MDSVQPSSKIISITFNQSRSTFVAGTETGFAIYKTNPLEKLCERNLGGGIGIAVQLFESNFIGLVGGGENPRFPVNQFVLWNDYTEPNGEAVVEKVEKDKIVAVRLNNEIAAVVTRKCAMLYSLKTMALVKKVKTSSNPDGICDMSSCTGTVFLCPGMEQGTVNIVDYKAMTERTVNCCSHPLRSITLNTATAEPPGSGSSQDLKGRRDADTLFATTSVEGTLIRVYDVATQTLLRELRRGSDASEIYGVCFSPDSRCLAVTSSKNTAHVFSLDKDFENQSSRASFLGAAIGYFGSEWSSFGIEFTPAASAPTPGGPQFQPRVGPVRHLGCVFPTSQKALTDAYRLLLVSQDGAYAIHDLQFKDHKSIPRTSGLLSQLVRPSSSVSGSEK